MQAKTVLKASVFGAFLYAASPLAQIATVDTAQDAISNGITADDAGSPNVVRSSALAKTVYEDGFHLDDSVNFWRARLSPDLDDCISEETAVNYTGAVTWLMHDKAECLSELTGVDVEDILPEPEDGYVYDRYMRIHGEPDEEAALTEDVSLG